MKRRLEEFSLLSGTKRFAVWQGNKHIANFADFQDAQAFLAIPDLLEACKAAKGWTQSHGGWNTDLEAKLSSAIAKAEGKE